MTLETLRRIGQLKKHDANAAEVARLVQVARQSLADAKQKNISVETRFDAAYKAIMQVSLVAIMACGYRPDTKKAQALEAYTSVYSFTVGGCSVRNRAPCCLIC
jgi:hypothetical protein